MCRKAGHHLNNDVRGVRVAVGDLTIDQCAGLAPDALVFCFCSDLGLHLISGLAGAQIVAAPSRLEYRTVHG